ncbi:TolB family protein [Parapedobacter pyrenivorans]|uniref:TolB family protein n=1 Tax=Parapedobacter pyrenivorans TaxID=1305674 RepID=UPI00333E27AB
MIYNIRSLAKFVCALFLMLSCSKDEAPGPDGDNGTPLPADLEGLLLYDWVDEGVLAVDVKTGRKSVFITDDVRANGFDVSRDGKLRLTSGDIQGNYDASRYTLSNTADGSIVSQFTFYPPNGGTKYNHGKLSPDNTLIMIPPTFEEGIIVLDTEGKPVVHIEAINNEPFDHNDVAEWLPGNALLFTHGDYILKASPPYTQATLVKEMNYESWGAISPSQDGQRVAVRIDKHIYLMDIDGSNLTQVTESNFQENMAVFSPNGKYLLVGTHYRRTGVFGAIWELKIIPADGKAYNVDPITPNTAGVIPVIPIGEDRIETGDGIMLWR